jgi:hypothetical protein
MERLSSRFRDSVAEIERAVELDAAQGEDGELVEDALGSEGKALILYLELNLGGILEAGQLNDASLPSFLHLLLLNIVSGSGGALCNHIAVEKVTDQAARGGRKTGIDNNIDIMVWRQRC